MPSPAQTRALNAHRRRIAERGLGRFEVRGREADKDLIRDIARRLAADDAAAQRLRADLNRRLGAAEPPVAGGILAALRRSPMVGADLDLSREDLPGRDSGL